MVQGTKNLNDGKLKGRKTLLGLPLEEMSESERLCYFKEDEQEGVGVLTKADRALMAGEVGVMHRFHYANVNLKTQMPIFVPLPAPQSLLAAKTSNSLAALFPLPKLRVAFSS